MKKHELMYEVEKCHALLGHVEAATIALLKRAEKAEAEVARLQAQIESMRKEK